MQVQAAPDIANALRDRGIAVQLYALVAVPMVEDAPHIPLAIYAIDGSNRTLSQQFIQDVRLQIWKGFQSIGVPLLGHVSDGDSRLRRAALRLMRLEPGETRPGIFISHPLIQLMLPEVCLSRRQASSSLLASLLTFSQCMRDSTLHQHYFIASNMLCSIIQLRIVSPHG